LFTDIVGSTQRAEALGDRRWRQLLSDHNRIMRRDLKRFHGREIDTAGDGFFATFEQPSEAISCALAMFEDLRPLDIEIRAGVHMGEVEVMGPTYGGISVHVAARVMSKADASQLLVSSTVRDLMAGADIEFDDLGFHELKGVASPVHLYSVRHEVQADEESIPRPEVEPEPGPGARRSRIFWPAAGVAALIVAIGLIAFVRARGDSSTPFANAVVALDPSNGAVADVVAVGTRPSSLAEDGDSLWVANFDDKTVQRVDTKARQADPARGVANPTGIAVGGGSVWVTNGFAGQLIQIDPAQANSGTPLALSPGIAGVAYGEDAVWIASPNDGTLIRLDPLTHETKNIPLPAGSRPQDVAVGEGAVWVADASGRVLAVDPASLRVTKTLPLLNDREASRIAVGEGYVWVTSTPTDSVIRIDPSAGTLTTIEHVADGPLGIAAGGGSVWVAGSLDGSVVRLDPVSATVTGSPIELGFSPTAVALSPDGIWVSLSATP
jgi:DNA-binding beta-propeller fold protein YncE